MTTTTSYGTWVNHIESTHLTVEQSVYEWLGDYADDYDLDELTAAYRAAINAALPGSVHLVGDEFIGPHSADDADWDGEFDIKAVVDSIDFYALAEKYDTSA